MKLKKPLDNSLFFNILLISNSRYYHAEVTPLDFLDPGALITINQWVKDKTHDKIEKIIDHIDPESVMFLINAIYFKGTWKYRFNEEETSEQPFFDEKGDVCTTVEMMALRNELEYYEDELLQAVDLPYGDGHYRMTVILPVRTSSLDGVVSYLNRMKWEEITRSFTPSDVNLFLPKFRIDFSKELKDPLSRLGLAVAFDPHQANFNRITPGEKENELHISSVRHKTFLKTDEAGTEAAAATAISIENGTTSTSTPSPIIFRVDRPFLFAIREKTTGAILFLGKITKPEKKD